MPLVPVCPVCQRNGMKIVPAHGRQPNDVLLLGEGPSFEELKYMIPFVGKAGRELNEQYLPIAGLRRDEIRVSNVTLTAFPGFTNPEPWEAAECSSYHLPGELAKTDPEYVIVCGAVALSVFGDWDIELEHGRPLYGVQYGNWNGTLFVTFHPAAGLNQAMFQQPLREDFEDLHKWRHGKLDRAVDQYPYPEYRELRTVEDFESVIVDPLLSPVRYGIDDLNDMRAGRRNNLDYAGRYIYTDTEYHQQKMHCLTFSCAPGTGYLIDAQNTEMMRFYCAWLKWVRARLVFHSYLADKPMYDQAELPSDRWVDTLMEAYRMGMYGRGLKTLGYRIAGMQMQDFDDLVAPYAREEATRYLYLAAATYLQWYVEELPWKQGKRSCSGSKKHGGKHQKMEIVFNQPEELIRCPLCGNELKSPKMERDKGGTRFIWDRAAGILSDMEKRPKTDPQKRWYAIPEEEREVMEAEIGKMPRGSILQVPRDKLIWYACRDSDATCRIRGPLYRRAAEQARIVRRSWR